MDLCLPYYQRHNCTYLTTATTLKEQPSLYHTTRHNNIYLSSPTTTITNTSLPYYQTQQYLPVFTNHYNYKYLSTILPDTTIFTCLHQPLQLQIPLYHTTRHNNIYLSSPTTTITNTSLPYYQTQQYLPVFTNHYNYKYLSTILSDTTVLTCLQKPPYNNIHLSTILPKTQLHLFAYRNHLTTTYTCLPYYLRHNCIYLPTATTLQ